MTEQRERLGRHAHFAKLKSEGGFMLMRKNDHKDEVTLVGVFTDVEQAKHFAEGRYPGTAFDVVEVLRCETRANGRGFVLKLRLGDLQRTLDAKNEAPELLNSSAGAPLKDLVTAPRSAGSS